MDLKGGAPYWFLLHGLRATVPPLDRDAECDVAIIGSGITGALMAWRLVREGMEVLVLDRRDLAQGSTVASTALLQYDLDVPLHKLETSLGWAKSARAYRMGVEAIDLLKRIGGEVGVPVGPVPSLYFTQDAGKTAELRAEFACRQRAGLDVCWVEEQALLEDWGIDARAAICSAAGAQVDPYALTHALLAYVLAAGAPIHDRTTVTAIETDAAGVALRTDRGPTVRARTVIHATGYEAAESLPSGMVQLASTYVVATEPVPTAGRARRCLLWEYADPYLYARWAGDRVLVGGEDIPFRNARHRDRRIPSKGATLLGRLGALLPGHDFEAGFAWAGTFATTEDGIGFIGPAPDRPREYFALGFGGNGITFSALATQILLDAIQGQPNRDADLFRLDR